MARSGASERPVRRGWAVLGYGFRPFFLLAGAYAAIAVPAFLIMRAGLADAPVVWPPMLWHAHEMIFGYATAVIAGFLLTAVPGWQQAPPVAGVRLGVLVALWAAGRAAMWTQGLWPPLAVAAVDLAFLPALVAVGVPALLAPRAARNRIFLAVLSVLVLANLLIHAAAAGRAPFVLGADLGLDTLALLIAILGGRVVPAFTTNALAAGGRRGLVRAADRRDVVAVATVVLVLLADGLSPWIGTTVPALLALLAAAANAWRMVGWGTPATRHAPIVWVLHLGYAWLAVGLAAKGLGGLGLIDPASARHGIAVGAVGTMPLAVMTRAALGHTGRPIVAAKPIVLAYVLVSLAAIGRLAAPLADWLVSTSGLAWSLAFVLFTVVYAPILCRPRPDGRPG